MLLFIFKRFLWGIPVLLTVATLTFAIMHIVPGGPFDREKKLPPEIKANVEAKYHLDKPVHKQYFLYIYGLIKGDLGPSYKYLGRDVRDIIKDTFPVSIQLGVLALFISIIIGIGTGVIAGIKSDTIWDRLTILFATTGISLPNFILGIILSLLFSHFYKVLPPALWEGWYKGYLPRLNPAWSPCTFYIYNNWHRHRCYCRNEIRYNMGQADHPVCHHRHIASKFYSWYHIESSIQPFL